MLDTDADLSSCRRVASETTFSTLAPCLIAEDSAIWVEQTRTMGPAEVFQPLPACTVKWQQAEQGECWLRTCLGQVASVQQLEHLASARHGFRRCSEHSFIALVRKHDIGKDGEPIVLNEQLALVRVGALQRMLYAVAGTHSTINSSSSSSDTACDEIKAVRIFFSKLVDTGSA